MFLERLFDGAPVVIEQLGLGEDIPAPHPDEAAQVARAVSKRRREFAAGRHLARRALARLGEAGEFEEVVLLNGADRAPLWPAGVVGSITHTGAGDQGYCAVVLGRDSELAAVGIDAEEAEPLEPDLWKFVLTADERAALEQEPAETRGLLAKVVFSAKECFYKAQYPLTRQFLGFQQVRITLIPALGQFVAERVDDGGEMSRCLGRYSMDGDLVLTGIAVFPEAAGVLGFGGKSRADTALEGDLGQGQRDGDRDEGSKQQGKVHG
jgi:4'-phosphopantetheinyl transferase EntD